MSHHRIRALAFKGGFLDGVRLEFEDSLNCIIGGRGTGKTTVLESIRYALDRMPDPELDRGRRQALEKLIEGNLGGGSVSVEVETRDGIAYTISRGVGERPFVTNAEGTPVQINVAKDIVFGVDIYSQNQIEDISNDAYFQLELIDKFVRAEVDELEAQIRETTGSLEMNAAKILDARKLIDDLTEATRELPDVEEKIRGFERADGGGGEALGVEHQRKELREREAKLGDGARALFGRATVAIDVLVQQLGRGLDDLFDFDFASTPNREVVQRLRDQLQTAIQSAASRLDAAKQILMEGGVAIRPVEAALLEQHAQQEKHYRELLDQYAQERAKGVERTRLAQRHAELKAKEKQRSDRTTELARLAEGRSDLRASLSDLRDRRYEVRLGVARMLNERLSPMIRVSVEQFGNAEAYRALLARSMKGSGLRYAAIVDRAIDRIPPAELASLIQSEDRVALERELEIDGDRATRLIIQLKDTPDVFAIETVELHDRPLLELKDGSDYKDASSLSTGQKCTTILPMLLMESERPLIVDQPEDNLDNAFIFETIVQSLDAVRGRRQLIFVTHNPNIPVLGDAARVFALRSTGREASVANSGSVDDVAHEIMTILEGGRAAFEARRKRYGRPVPGADEA